MRVFLSRFIKVVVLSFLLLALLIALIPTIMNTDWGRRQAVAWMNRSISGSIEIRHMTLHWGKGQIIEGFLLKDPEGQAVLEFDKFSTEATLWQLIRKSSCLGFTQIENLNAAIITDQKGNTNLQRALGIHASHTIPPLAPSTIVLSDVNVESDLFTPNHPLSIQVRGLTRQENLNGSFDINLSLNGLWASDWEELKRDAQKYFSIEGSKEAKLQAHVVNFPIDLLDRIAALQNPHLNGFFHSLLGDRLNLNLDKEPSDEGVAFNMALMAPLLQGDMKGIIKKDAIILKEPGIFHLNLVPQSINPFIPAHFELLNPSRVEIVLSELMIPLNFFTHKEESDPCLFGFNAELKIPETNLDINSIGNIKVLNLLAHLTSLQCDKLIQAEVIGQAKQGKMPFDIHFTSEINKPKNLSDLMDQVHQSMRSTLTISELPLQIIPFFYKHPEWSEKMGSYVNAQLDIRPRNKNEWMGILSFQTPKVILKEAQLSIGNQITLLSPAYFTLAQPSDCLAKLLNQDSLLLDQPCHLNFVLKQLRMPLDEPHLTALELESSISNLRFAKLLDWGILQFDDCLVKIEGQNLEDFNSSIAGKLLLLNSNGTTSPLVPESLAFKQNSKWKLDKDGLMEMPSGQLQMTNSITNIQLDYALNSQSVLELTQPAQLQYTLSPLAFQSLGKILHKKWPLLQESMSIKLSIEPTDFALKSFSLADLYVQGLLQIKKIALQDSSGDVPILENMIIPWVIDFPRNNIYTNIKGLAYNRKEGKPSQISAQVQFWLKPGYYDIAHTQSEIQMDFSGIPTSMLNILFEIPDLNSIVGPILDLGIKAFFDPTKEKPGFVNIVIDSTNFHTNARLRLTDHITLYEEQKHPNFRLIVTPESYKHIIKLMGLQDDQQLAAPFTATGVIADVNIPIGEAWPEKGIFDFKFFTTSIQWQDANIPPLKLEGRLDTQNLKDQLNFSFQVQAKTPLAIEGNLTQLFDSKNRLHNWQEMGIKARLNGQQLSPNFLQRFLPLGLDQKQKLQALFGDSLDIRASAQMQNLNGPLQAFVKGPQGEISLDGQLKSGVLTLNKPLEGSVKVTPLFIQTFLTSHVPLLSSAVGAENPLTFAIDASQFSCPLIPFQLDQVKIGKGQLNLGKLNFRNEGELQSILSMIRPITGQYLTIWFTPIYFDLNHGILSLKRFDMLVGNAYTLANWGSINVMKQQANFVLGLTAQTLQYAFGVQGLENNYMLQIPLHTANGKVEVDKKKAIARISSLAAQMHGGDKGKLLGNILDMVLSEKGESYPPPTTQPFPWQEEFDSSSTSNASPKQVETPAQSQDIPPEEKKKKKKRKLLDDENLKDLQEGALQLLDQWLK